MVADIGCDHGLLGLALTLGDRGRHPMLQRVIGVDRAAAPLAVARRNLARQRQKAAEEDGDAFVVNGRRVELRLGEGLQALSGADGVDTVCMAGMGTKTIVGVLSSSAARDVLSSVQRLVVQVSETEGEGRAELVPRGLHPKSIRTSPHHSSQAYDPRPLFMHDLRSHLTSTLKAQRLGPDGKGYAIVDERIVWGAEGRAFVTLLAQATTALGSKELDDVNEEEDDANASFQRLLLGRHLRRRAAHEAQTRVVYEDYLRHHREWYAQVVAARAQSNTGEKWSGRLADPAARALVAIEQEMLDLQSCKM